MVLPVDCRRLLAGKKVLFAHVLVHVEILRRETRTEMALIVLQQRQNQLGLSNERMSCVLTLDSHEARA